MHVLTALVVLVHKFAQIRDDSELPIAYMSAKLTRAQRNYSVTELECLAAYIESQ